MPQDHRPGDPARATEREDRPSPMPEQAVAGNADVVDPRTARARETQPEVPHGGGGGGPADRPRPGMGRYAMPIAGMVLVIALLALLL